MVSNDFNVIVFTCFWEYRSYNFLPISLDQFNAKNQMFFIFPSEQVDFCKDQVWPRIVRGQTVLGISKLISINKQIILEIYFDFLSVEELLNLMRLCM